MPLDAAAAYQRLHPRLRQELRAMGWNGLRELQALATSALLEGEGDLLVSAGTGAGKTEAAFLPVLSSVFEDPPASVGVLYLGPLKALINDQFRRVEDLCRRAEVPVTRWHGDVGAGPKRRLVEEPEGVLLTTPESLEAMFVRRAGDLPALFGDLRFVVLDELHAFLGSARGAHLRSLLARLARVARARPRRVGLSATFGDAGAVARWLSGEVPCEVLEAGGAKTIKLQVHGYRDPAPPEEGKAGPPPVAPGLVADILKHFEHRPGLVFGTSKAGIEAAAAAVREAAPRPQKPRFGVHHASLSRGEREASEADLREDSPSVVFCSSTLEMGIDVGRLEVVGQLGPPASAASLAQRLGRSGRRRGEASILRVYVQEPAPGPGAPLLERLHLPLLQAVAVTDLVVREGFSEPPVLGGGWYSVLAQQVLSMVLERRGVNAATLHRELCAQGAFPEVSSRDFAGLLRALAAAEVLEQLTQGDLILGAEGEKLAREHGFYASFATSREVSVVAGGEEIGRLPASGPLVPGVGLRLGGRSWRVTEVRENGEVLVVPGAGDGQVGLAGGGGAAIHTVVRRRMRGLLAPGEAPGYLDDEAQALLEEARAAAHAAGLPGRTMVAEGGGSLWLPWVGTRAQTALLALAEGHEELRGRVELRGAALLIQGRSPEKAAAALRAAWAEQPSAEALAARAPRPALEKYDHLLPPELRARAFAAAQLDLEGAAEAVGELDAAWPLEEGERG